MTFVIVVCIHKKAHTHTHSHTSGYQLWCNLSSRPSHSSNRSNFKGCSWSTITFQMPTRLLLENTHLIQLKWWGMVACAFHGATIDIQTRHEQSKPTIKLIHRSSHRHNLIKSGIDLSFIQVFAASNTYFYGLISFISNERPFPFPFARAWALILTTATA